jgi:hypothetical protein
MTGSDQNPGFREVFRTGCLPLIFFFTVVAVWIAVSLTIQYQQQVPRQVPPENGLSANALIPWLSIANRSYHADAEQKLSKRPGSEIVQCAMEYLAPARHPADVLRERQYQALHSLSVAALDRDCVTPELISQLIAVAKTLPGPQQAVSQYGSTVASAEDLRQKLSRTIVALYEERLIDAESLLQVLPVVDYWNQYFILQHEFRTLNRSAVWVLDREQTLRILYANLESILHRMDLYLQRSGFVSFNQMQADLEALHGALSAAVAMETMPTSDLQQMLKFMTSICSKLDLVRSNYRESDSQYSFDRRRSYSANQSRRKWQEEMRNRRKKDFQKQVDVIKADWDSLQGATQQKIEVRDVQPKALL